MDKLIKIAIPVLIVVAGFTASRFMGTFKTEIPRKERPPVIRNLPVIQAEYSAHTPEISLLGKIEALDKVNLTPEVSGKILNNGFRLRKGMTFRKGQVLMRLDGSTSWNQLKIQISSLLSGVGEMLPDMKVDLPEASIKWQEFFASLSFENIPELPQWESEREKMYLTRFNIFSLYYAAKNQQILSAKYTLYAPFSGTVASSSANPGNMAGAGQPLAQLVRTDIWEMAAPVTQSEAPWVRAGQEVQVHSSNNDEVYAGKISRISSVLDPQTQTLTAIIRLTPARGSAILDGSYGEAKIQGMKIPGSFAMPRAALYQGRDAVVLDSIENGIGVVAFRPVKIAFAGKDSVYILDGPRPGEWVASVPVQGIVEGGKARPQKPEATENETGSAKDNEQGAE